jgi:hypothetical protein
MVGFDEDVELGCNQYRICANYVRIGCLERERDGVRGGKFTAASANGRALCTCCSRP